MRESEFKKKDANANDEPQRFMTHDELKMREDQDYGKAYDELTKKIALFPERNPNASKAEREFYQAGGEVVAAIRKQEDQPHFDIKYSTMVLKKTDALLDAPGDGRLRLAYRALAKHDKKGQPSCWKRVVGAMLALVGLAAIVVGAVILASATTIQGLSLNASSPVTIPGMVLGGVLMGVGVGLFAKSFPQGVTRAMERFDEKSVAVSAERSAQVLSNASGLSGADSASIPLLPVSIGASDDAPPYYAPRM